MLFRSFPSHDSGVMASEGREPKPDEMKQFWLTLVGRSYKDTGASFYKELSEARTHSNRFDQVTNDVYSLLCNNKIVKPEELRDRLLSKLDSKWYLLQGRDQTMSDNTYLKNFDQSKLDNKLETKPTNSSKV